MKIPIGFEGLLASMLGKAVDEVANGAHDPLTRSLLRWVGRVQAQVMLRWRPVVTSGVRCAIGQRMPDGQVAICVEPAIGSCCFCGAPTCLHHALIDENANILCYRCLNEAARSMGKGQPNQPQARNEVPPPPAVPTDKQKRREYLEVMGLEDPVTVDELEEAFRTLMRKHHPDRAPEKRRAKAEARCKKITEAYHWLKEHQKRAA